MYHTIAAETLAVEEKDLKEALLFSISVTRGETIKKTYTCQQVWFSIGIDLCSTVVVRYNDLYELIQHDFCS